MSKGKYFELTEDNVLEFFNNYFYEALYNLDISINGAYLILNGSGKAVYTKTEDFKNLLSDIIARFWI